MKNNMKKIIITVFSLVLLLAGTRVFASGPFNGQSGDCPNMGIGVYGNIQRDSWGCWTASSVTANAGDTVNVVMYYHNNTASTLTGVSASLLTSGTGPASSYTFSGNMHSDQGDTSLGSVSLNLNSSQTLTYQSTHWMKDKQAIDSDTDTGIVNMNNTTALLGSEPSGWNDYGELLVVFKVGNNNNNNNYSNCTISNFTANGSSYATVQSGNPVNLVWNTYNCTSVTVSGPNMSSNYSSSGSATTYPTYSGTYTISAYGGNNGTQTQSVYVTVNNYVTPIYVAPTPVYNNCAVTTTATNIGGNSATLNGFISGIYSATAYFEYGTTVNMGSQTASQTVVANGYMTNTLTGLIPNTTYYFRLVANCQNSISRGTTQIFETAGGQGDVAPVEIIHQGTTIVGTQSPIMLKIEDRYQSVSVGDTIDYTVTYKNIGKRKLTHPMIQVVLPNGILFMNTSKGTFSNSNNTLSVPIDDLNAGDDGVIYLQGKVGSFTSGNSQIVTTALLIYTNTNNAQENAMAYVLNNPNGNGNSLTGNAFFAGLFGMSLLGWLLLVLIILAIILLTRRYFPSRYPNGHQ